MSSNIGSVATITGNPQNMMIGSFSGISPTAPFAAALARLWPAAGLVFTVAVIAPGLPRGIPNACATSGAASSGTSESPAALENHSRVSAGMIVFFFARMACAQSGGGLPGRCCCFTRRVKPEKVYREIDW